MGITTEDIINNVDPEKVTMSFGLFVLSKQNDEDLMGYLHEFRDLYRNVILKKEINKIPQISKSDDVVKNHKMQQIKKDVDNTTDRDMIDLGNRMKQMKLDKDSWYKIFRKMV